MPRLTTSLRGARTATGASQEVLARASGISRQAYAAIEAGKATPSTEVSLRLAQALDTTVEALFRLPDPETPTVDAELASGQAPPETPVRVRLDRVGERRIARPLRGGPPNTGILHQLPPAQGMAHAGGESGHVRVEVWPSQATPSKSVVVAGCDPASAVVASCLRPRDVDLVWSDVSSQAALEELSRGHAHVAGCHLLDEASGQYNVPWARRLLPFPITVVTFAVWEQGLLVAPGNPKGIRGVEDLARPGISMVNRATGSGSRALLDRCLEMAGVACRDLAGYDLEASGHLMVAEVVAMGLADAGVGVKAAAVARGLEFISLGQEQYDLVVPEHFLDLDPVQELLASLRRPELRRQVEALEGYDTANMGTPVSGT